MKRHRSPGRSGLQRGLDVLAWPFSRRRLRPGQLLDAASRRTGLRDFGPDGPHEEALGVLCEALEHEARLSPLGRVLARQTLVSGLETQLRLAAELSARPGLLEVPIEQPVVVIGMPRTGTTILHELLALDPKNRCPLSWEVARPFPAPDNAAGDGPDPRIAAVTREFAFSERLMPGLQSMHRIGATLPQECVGITAFVFSSMQYPTIWHIPSYQRWLQRDCDHRRVYAFHRRFLQFLQDGKAGLRWVLKSPAHLWQLPALLATYPDARLVQTHRDPLAIVSSLASMLSVMRGAYSAHVDLTAIAREWLAECASALDASVAARRAGVIPPAQVLDIPFRDFMASAPEALRRLYAYFGLAFDEDLALAITRYVRENPAGGNTGHRHRFIETGLDPVSARAAVSAYQAYFDVPSEVDAPTR